MTKTNLFLLATLVVQAVLIAIIILSSGNTATDTEATALLADFNRDTVTSITITNGTDGNQIRLTKLDDGTWGLADIGNYPVQETRITSLFDVLAGLDTSRLISDNASNQRRLKVADEEYERKVELVQGDQTITLYVGSSGGANATHTRIAGSDNVYLNRDVSGTSISAEITTWAKTDYITVDATKVVSMTLTNANGTFEFEKVGDVWQMAGLEADETFNEENFTALLDKIVAFNLRKPLGTETLPEYGMDAPLATVTIVVRDTLVTGEDENSTGQTLDTTYELVVGARYEDGYAVKSNKSDFYVLASAFYATDFTEETREEFLVAVGN
ncbi:MAG: DUF4340 domain-containing protein [Anaerolineae bacterium]|jgi:hypothetical protein|nr:DUF4340 domain-containing protein [Anaerolineae bacterium]